MNKVSELLRQLLAALYDEQRSDKGTTPGPVLESILEHNSLRALVDGVLETGDPRVYAELLGWYAETIDGLDRGWLKHSAVNKPL